MSAWKPVDPDVARIRLSDPLGVGMRALQRVIPAALMGYAEWGTRLAMHNSSDVDDIVEHAPVPRWGWGVAPPYQP